MHSIQARVEQPQAGCEALGPDEAGRLFSCFCSSPHVGLILSRWMSLFHVVGSMAAIGVDFQITVEPTRERPPLGLSLTQLGSSAHLTNQLWLLRSKNLAAFMEILWTELGKDQ